MRAASTTTTRPTSRAPSRSSGDVHDAAAAIYELVLDAQLRGDRRRRGRARRSKQMHDDARRRASPRASCGSGSCRARSRRSSKTRRYKPFYMHRPATGSAWTCTTSATTTSAARRAPLEPGMVLTVEPGLYIGKDDDKVAAEWRGIGVRIEDDILVTDGSPDNLTQAIPKTVAEASAGVGRRS